MPTYAYEVRDAEGRIEAGVLSAGDILAASQSLRKEGTAILSLRAERASGGSASRPVATKRIKKDDVLCFASQLAVMVDTGVPLAESLDAIGGQSDSPAMRLIVQDLSEQVKGGTAFSLALEKYPKVFGGLFAAMMRASEASHARTSRFAQTAEIFTLT